MDVKQRTHNWLQTTILPEIDHEAVVRQSPSPVRVSNLVFRNDDEGGKASDSSALEHPASTAEYESSKMRCNERVSARQWQQKSQWILLYCKHSVQ